MLKKTTTIIILLITLNVITLTNTTQKVMSKTSEQAPNFIRFMGQVNQTRIINELEGYNYTRMKQNHVGNVYFKNKACTRNGQPMGGFYYPSHDIEICMKTVINLRFALLHEEGHSRWFNILKPDKNSDLCKKYKCGVGHWGERSYLGYLPNSEDYANAFARKYYYKTRNNIELPSCSFTRLGDLQFGRCDTWGECYLLKNGSSYEFKCEEQK